MSVFEYGVFMGMFGPKMWRGVTGGWRNLHNERFVLREGFRVFG